MTALFCRNQCNGKHKVPDEWEGLMYLKQIRNVQG